MASLIVVGGRDDRINLEEGKEYLIGQLASCDIHIPVNSVSRNHARIVGRNGRFTIEDLWSKNKTYLNKEQLVPSEPKPLHDNDSIRICNWVFKFLSESTLVEVGEADSSSTVQATIDLRAQKQLLESQPSEQLHALLKISNTLGKIFEEETIFSQVAEILSEVFRKADRCFVILRNRSTGKLESAISHPRSIPGQPAVQFSSTIVEKVLVSGEALLFDATGREDDAVGEPKSVVESRIRSAIVAPLVGRDGKAFGLIQLDKRDAKPAFTRDDLSLLVGVANQAAMALENARLHEIALKAAKFEQDAENARFVQRSFLPTTLPDVSGYEFFAFYHPARNVGGDYYDFIPDARNRIGVFVGDVAGKGVTAALVMAKFSAQARACLPAHTDLIQAIDRLNEQAVQTGMPDRFITLSVNVLDPVAHRVTLVSAGHPSPLIYRNATNTIENAISLAQTGYPLGINDRHLCEPAVVDLLPGDCLIAYTDGVTEARDAHQRQFGRDGISRAILTCDSNDVEAFSPRQIGDRIIVAVLDYQSGKEQDDDIALVCFGRWETSRANPYEPFELATSQGSITQELKLDREAMAR